MKYSNACVMLLTLFGGIASIRAKKPQPQPQAQPSNFDPLPRVIKAFAIQPAKSLEKKSHYQPIFDDVPNVLEVARKNHATKFADFASNTSWLKDTLHGPGKVTIFAFSDDAYNHSSSAVKVALTDIWDRNQILQYHVASGVYFGHDISDDENKIVYSLYPSPPFKRTPQWQFQPIQLDSYLVDSGSGRSTVKTASGSPITTFDLTASNGIVHIIDRVMYPIPTGSNLARYLETEPNYSTLHSALETANLTLALSTPDFKPLTLLAPNNGAFKGLSKAQQELLKNTTILQQVLTYHVMVGSYYSAAIYEDFQRPSLEGSTIYFQKGKGGVSAEGKMVVNFDTTVTNGVVHELDGVMFPRSLNHLLSNE